MRSQGPVERVRDVFAAQLLALPSDERFAVALSGGRDSVVLLDAACAVAPARTCAIHVHHGLSPHADAWQQFCESLCASRGVALRVQEVDVARGPQRSVEEEARRARYGGLASTASAIGVRFVALAHHRDDQAETLVLQLLRGAGPHGLSAMAPFRSDARGVTWWRPLLELARADVDAYVAETGLRFVDDESNAQTRYARNAVRHTVMPVLASVVRNPARVLARAASHQAEAAQLADDVAASDAQRYYDGATLAREALVELAPYRARNLLRWFLRQRGRAMPSTARLDAMIAQLAGARGDASIRIAHAGAEVGLFAGRIVVHPPPPATFDVAWRGEPDLALPHGRLVFARTRGDGIDEGLLENARVRVRQRCGGERLQLACDRPRRALKSFLREARLPPWERQALPLVYCDGALAAVAGIGVDVAFAAGEGMPGVTLTWTPSVP